MSFIFCRLLCVVLLVLQCLLAASIWKGNKLCSCHQWRNLVEIIRIIIIIAWLFLFHVYRMKSSPFCHEGTSLFIERECSLDFKFTFTWCLRVQMLFVEKKWIWKKGKIGDMIALLQSFVIVSGTISRNSIYAVQFVYWQTRQNIPNGRNHLVKIF